jgi:ubiquinone/menaquinone biosynthesis C-methylase UbiE
VPDAIRHPLFARFYAWFAPLEDRAGVAEYRHDLVSGLRGRVLELGVGTGLSFRHYPPEVEQLVAVEPEPTMRANAAKAAREVALDVQLVEGTADALPAPDASVDAAVVSQVLCSVPDQARALAELRRVLRPGGELRFYEHVIGTSKRLSLLQRGLAPGLAKVFGGCRADRDTGRAIEEAGFRIERNRRFLIRAMNEVPAAPRILGTARRV